MYREKLRENYNFLDNHFKQHGIEWAVVTKLLCGNELFLKEVLNLGVREVCDSRLSNLETVKKLNPNVQTVYIKPPPVGSLEEVVQFADVSFNSESSTIKLLSDEAVRQNKVHKVTIMIELGDLREGIMGDDLMDFYKKVFELPNIEIVAIGSNLNCLHGVMPSKDKLIQLSLYKQLIEATFNKKIPWVTGGTSVVLPLLFRKELPKSINHFRIGETLYFGNDLFDGSIIDGMHEGVFRLYSEIIEITEKPKVPIGELAENPSGETFEINEDDYGKTSYRAILDIGLLDIDPSYLKSDDSVLSFDIKYMGVLSLMNSDYIEKHVV
jgi:predicted amino acid racemase